jgi:hypothetical protein
MMVCTIMVGHMSDVTPEFQLGILLRGSADVGHATAGLYAADGKGSRYVLTAADAFRSGAGDGIVVRVDNGQRIGVAEPRAKRDSTFLADAILAIKLDDDLNLRWPEAYELAHILAPAPMEDLLGQEVVAHFRSGKRSGTVAKTFVVGRQRSDEPKLERFFQDGIEVRFSGTEAFQKGDAGTPVLNAEGAFVGLVIAGDLQRALIAPIQRFLAKNAMKLLPPTAYAGVNPRYAESLVKQAERVWKAEPELETLVDAAAA